MTLSPSIEKAITHLQANIRRFLVRKTIYRGLSLFLKMNDDIIEAINLEIKSADYQYSFESGFDQFKRFEFIFFGSFGIQFIFFQNLEKA